jgi:hypothetical protein
MSKDDILREIATIHSQHASLNEEIAVTLNERGQLEKALDLLILNDHVTATLASTPESQKTPQNQPEESLSQYSHLFSPEGVPNLPPAYSPAQLRADTHILSARLSQDAHWLGRHVRALDQAQAHVSSALSRVDSVLRLANIAERVSAALDDGRPEHAAKLLWDALGGVLADASKRRESFTKPSSGDPSSPPPLADLVDQRMCATLLTLEARLRTGLFAALASKQAQLDAARARTPPPPPTAPLFADLLGTAAALARVGAAGAGLDAYCGTVSALVEAQLMAAELHPAQIPSSAGPSAVPDAVGAVAQALAQALGTHTPTLRSYFGRGAEVRLCLRLTRLAEALLVPLLERFTQARGLQALAQQAHAEAGTPTVVPCLAERGMRAAPSERGEDLSKLDTLLEDTALLAHEASAVAAVLDQGSTRARQQLRRGLWRGVSDARELGSLAYFEASTGTALPAAPAAEAPEAQQAEAETLASARVCAWLDMAPPSLAPDAMALHAAHRAILGRCCAAARLIALLQSGSMADPAAGSAASLCAEAAQELSGLYVTLEMRLLSRAVARALAVDAADGKYGWEVGPAGTAEVELDEVPRLSAATLLQRRLKDNPVGSAVSDCAHVLKKSLDRALSLGGGTAATALANHAAAVVVDTAVRFYAGDLALYAAQYGSGANARALADASAAHGPPSAQEAVAAMVALGHVPADQQARASRPGCLAAYRVVREAQAILAVNAADAWRGALQALLEHLRETARAVLREPGEAGHLRMVLCCLQSLGEADAHWAQLVKRGVMLLASAVTPRLRPLLDEAATANYVLSDAEYGLTEGQPTWATALTPRLLHECRAYQACLLPGPHALLVAALASYTARKLYSTIDGGGDAQRAQSFTLLGAMRLDESVRGLVGAVARGVSAQTGVRDKFLRVVQACHVLQLGGVAEVDEYLADAGAGFEEWRLQRRDAIRLLGLRTDLDPAEASRVREALA